MHCGASEGFMKLGQCEIATSLPVFSYLLCANESNQLSRRQLILLLQPSFSEDGTNVRKSMKMIPTLHSQSMCEKLQVEEGVESLLGAFYNLQLGWMKNRPLALNYNLVFNLLLLMKGSSGLSFQKLTLVAKQCFYRLGASIVVLYQPRRNSLNFMILPLQIPSLDFHEETVHFMQRSLCTYLCLALLDLKTF